MGSPSALKDLQKLLPFVQVVKSGSFAAAAAALQVTPPAISKSIAALEAELGVRLFNRTTRSLRLTPEGEAFHASVRQLLQGLDDAVAALREGTGQARGRLRVSVAATFGRYALLPIIGAFTARHPEVALELSLDESPPGMVDAGLDVSIQHGQAQEASVVSRLLCAYPLLLAASGAYLDRRGTPGTPADLAAHDCIVAQRPGSGFHWDLVRVSGTDELPQRHVHMPQGPVTIRGQLDATLIVALYGGGITPAAQLVAQPYFDSGRLRRVLPDYVIHNAKEAASRIYVHVPHRRHLPAKVRVFLDFLYQRFSNDGVPPEPLQG